MLILVLACFYTSNINVLMWRAQTNLLWQQLNKIEVNRTATTTDEATKVLGNTKSDQYKV